MDLNQASEAAESNYTVLPPEGPDKIQKRGLLDERREDRSEGRGLQFDRSECMKIKMRVK